MTNSLLDEPTLVQIALFLTCVATKFIGGGATTPWRVGVLSRTDLNGVGGSYPSAFRPLVSMNPVAASAVLRSRKVGRGS